MKFHSPGAFLSRLSQRLADDCMALSGLNDKFLKRCRIETVYRAVY